MGAKKDVVQEQKTLAYLGLYDGPIDGEWNERTAQAYAGWQKMYDLDQDVVIPAGMENIRNSGKYFGGDKAVEKAREIYGDLTPQQEYIVRHEGFVDGVYLDQAGVPTYGIGQTGEYIGKGFGAAFAEKEAKAKSLFPKYDEYPMEMQREIMSGVYRGDLSGSPNTIKLFNSGKYKEAAKEFLNNAEYKSPDTQEVIKERMRAISKQMERMSDLDKLKMPAGLRHLVRS